MNDCAEDLCPCLRPPAVARLVIEFNLWDQLVLVDGCLLEVGEFEQAQQLLRDCTENLQVETPELLGRRAVDQLLAGLILMRAADQDEIDELRELGHHFLLTTTTRLAASDAGFRRTRP